MKEKRLALMTIIAGPKYQKIWEMAEPFFNQYADRIGADLVVLKEIPPNLPSPHWAKFSIYELLRKQYDRIAFIDGDVLIRPDTPSLFDVVPEDEFGIFNEGYYTPRSVCLHEVKKVYDVNLPNWNGKDYYNTGVMVVSRKHRHLFKVSDSIKPLRNSYGEQTYLNMRIMQSGEKVCLLNHRFNRMSIMDRLTGMTRLDSYIVHYAGFDVMGKQTILEAMKRDIEEWEKNPTYEYKRQVFIWSFGGAGDVVAAEPTVRYIKEKVYPDADIYIMTKDPALYDHIKDVYIAETYPERDFDAILEFNTHYVDHGQFHSFVPHSQVHPVDWISQAILGRTLDIKDREIHLEYSEKDLDEVREVSTQMENMILVHAGLGWDTKTFPKIWWEEVVNALVGKGYNVGLIGKRVNDAHGYVDIDIPENVVDFRDKLSMKGLIALIANAPVLVTNDSLPLHIAGAFDNSIVLIPTCKRADCLLPYRKGSIYHKAVSVCKKTIDDDNMFSPTAEVGWKLGGWQISKFKGEHTINEYLPDPQEVVQAAINFSVKSAKRQLYWNEIKGEQNGKARRIEGIFGGGTVHDAVEPDERDYGHAIFRTQFLPGTGREMAWNGNQLCQARP